MAEPQTAEEHFYSRYDWCLNPILTVRQLIYRFNEEVDACRKSGGWQREECKINLYLFACAIACTTDDYFNAPFVNFSPAYSRLPRLRPLLVPAEWAVNSCASLLRILTNCRAWRWRRRWNSRIQEVCDLLLGGTRLPAAVGAPIVYGRALSRLRFADRASSTSGKAPGLRLPVRLSNWKMRLPEAFRRQDFTHEDVISLIRHFCASNPPTNEPTAIIGLRTAGAYFAPLMAAYLKRANYQRVSWFSIRPKNGTSSWERSQLRKLWRRNTRVVLVDDYPATGSTLRLTLTLLYRLKLKPEQISLLAPTHTAQPNWVTLAEINPAINVFTVQPYELFKSALLKAQSVESWCAEYFPDSTAVRIVSNRGVDELNTRLAEHSKDGHHVREKRVFEIELANGGAALQRKKILVKSVGWGWLGYHAYIAGKRLQGFVPRVIGLRNGLLMMEWIETPEQLTLQKEHMVGVLASYVAARASTLRLTGDFEFQSRTYRWTGVDDIVRILGAAYGPYLSRVKAPRLRKELYRYVTATPTLIDGRMGPEEWLHTPDGVYKCDFEHHNFGGAEPDFADPAYDLAAGIFEFQLSKNHEDQLIDQYVRLTGDRTIHERIIVHKMFCASMEMRHAADRIAAGKQPDQNHQRYHQARNFLIYSMNQFCAALINVPGNPQWSGPLFFIDIDGVFDQDILGFPHATNSGLRSLMLLQSNGYSVVLNTGRGIQHVRKYCDAYGIQGGVAEFGSVFVDAVGKKDVPLIGSEAAAQLSKCREALRKVPGVFIDPGYEYSIRAYRFQGRSHVGLSKQEVGAILDDPDFNRLSQIATAADTYILQNGTNKGAGIAFVERYLNNTKPVTAVGHSDDDVPMLEAADHPYALRNCSRAVREMGKRGRCHIVKKSCQSGLLWAVEHRLNSDGVSGYDSSTAPSRTDCPDSLMSDILRAADRQPSWRVLADLFSSSL
jgi:hydroxymethylpyrimidine pyrophosphatase-like HAD family hydrolase/adenine/guanine phosphoribosyltransferase-like PRPP-binding protein